MGTLFRDRWLMLIAVAVLAVIGMSVAVVQLSAAAFSDTTENPGNNWATGVVELTDSLNGTAMFDVTGLVPGEETVNCLVVSYSGVAADVRLYGSTLVDPDGLATDLLLTVDSIDGDHTGDCATFVATQTHFEQPGNSLSAFAAAYTDFDTAAGTGTWSPPATASRTYRFAVVLDATSTRSGSSAEYTFVWEAQNS